MVVDAVSYNLVEVITLHSWCCVSVCVWAICSSFSRQLLYKFGILFCVKCLWLGIIHCECSVFPTALKPSLSTVWVVTMSLHKCTAMACNVPPPLSFLFFFFVTKTGLRHFICVYKPFSTITRTPCVRTRRCSQTITHNRRLVSSWFGLASVEQFVCISTRF